MKKLMMVAAAFALAMGVQAASYDWTIGDTCSGFMDGNNEENAAGMAYLYLDSGATSYSTILAAVSAGTFDASSYTALDSVAFDGLVNGTFGSSASAEYAGQTVFAVLLADKVTSYDTGDTIATLSNPMAYVVAGVEVPGTAAFGNTGIDFGSIYEASSASGGWAAQGVPEPTSGLLLLLGMAGLALKRKQA